MIEQKKRYFLGPENYFEWFVMLLAVANIVMTFETVEVEESVRRQWQRHLGAFCILLAFIQLYMLLVRIAPNTPIPVYINMFTTVLKTYTFILLRCVLTDYPIQSMFCCTLSQDLLEHRQWFFFRFLALNSDRFF